MVAFEPRYHVYQSAFANAIREHHPHTEVATAEPGEFEAEITCFDLCLVICSRPNMVPPNSRPAWVEFLLDPDRLTAICLDGEYWEWDTPGLDELLSIVDETERIARTKRDLGDCPRTETDTNPLPT